ncbi:hypothetical protein NW766_005061 [Fusarium irregulare]|uniref:Nucleoporin Nup159/Nup146 N-terminal domain-containing protein n=1 Tax=Fusarium irregulare TaxID=2494466 RepID=A0A9W8PT55_9HYPO|nr:hypothetical protein NW766_005061 [Fusarium irregulare]
MAFSFGNSGNAMLGSAAGAGGSTTGSPLETIQTDDLGFLSIAGDAKVRLTSPWTSLPSSTASLLSVASRKGLVAAAGPDQVIIATTESVRKAFEAPQDGDSEVRGFEPQLKIPMPMRVSQLSFTADENYLILSAESGGGLAVYEVQSLLSGSTNSAFELSTSGETLRAMIPNPTSEKAELCAIVTNNGNLHMANLKDRQISNPLKNQVSCVSWSAKGKQLCAGLGDGTIFQMTPEGEGKGEIPKPPNVDDFHVSSLTWLENHLFLSIHTSNNQSPPKSLYHLITRQPPSSYNFQQLTDPVEPFGSDKAPHHSILRLRDFPPALQDMLIVASTAVSEMGILTRSKTPLATDKPADSITGVFTLTEFLDDTKRPTLPMTDSMDDAVPIGVALDLSSKDKVYKPIPSDVELEESPGPLPGYWALTHDGVLCAWWVVYNESIRQGTSYPHLAAVEGTAPATPAPAAQPAPAASASPFGNPGASAFGSTAQLGQKSSPWGSNASSAAPSTGGAVFGSSGFGSAAPSSAPAFGKPSSIGFGQSSQLGSKSSPWASAAGGASAATPAFGQSGFSSFANNNNSSPFGQAAANGQSSTPTSGGFAGFASKSGFASVGNEGNTSVFGSGSKPAGSPFGSTSNAETAFPAKPSSGSPFGSTPFKLQSSFKPDGSAKDDNPKPTGSLFGSNFGSALTDASNKPAVTTPTPRDEEEMDTAGPTEETPQSKPKDTVFTQQSPESTTPTTTPAPSKFGFATSPAPQASAFGQPSKFGSTGGLFGNKSEAPKPSGGLFGSTSSTPKPSGGLFSSTSETPKASGGLFGSQQNTPKASIFGTQQKSDSYTGMFGQKSSKAESPKIKQEEDDAPLPPDPTPKANPFASPAASAKPEAAPLPPDFTSKPAKSTTKPAEAADAPLPPDFVNVSKPTEKETGVPDAPLPPDPTVSSKPRSIFDKPEGTPKAPSSLFPAVAGPPSIDSDDEVDDEEEEEDEEEEDEDAEEEDDNGSEGSGVDVAKDLSPTVSNLSPGYTPQSSFGGQNHTLGASRTNQEGSRQLFGELSRNAPVFPRPNATSPRSPSPVRGAVPNRVVRSDNMRSVSAPGIPANLRGSRQSRMGASITSKDVSSAEDPFVAQHRKMKAKQEAAETQPLVDEEDDEVHRLLASEVEGSLTMDEFIAHSNVAPPAKESIPSQVEAVYRDINSMIDTLGLNARTVKSFIKGHTENRKESGRGKDDLDTPEDWVLCEIDELGEVLDNELYADLEDGRVRDLDDKLEACHELTRDMHRLRAKQDDLKQILMIRTDPEQAEVTKSMPLSAEQATQQNELRREFAKFSKLLVEAEEALTLLKTRIAAASSASGKGKANVPTVDAVIRTIGKMTAMVEKRSGDIDVLENQMRKVTINPASREGSPMVTPQGRRSVMFSPEGTPVRNLRHSFAASMSLGASVRATTPRKKLSGYSQEEKGGLMQQRARRQAVLGKLKSSVEKQGVSVWTMEDIE